MPPENSFLTSIRRGSVLKKVDHVAVQKEKEEEKKKESGGGMFGTCLLTCCVRGCVWMVGTGKLCLLMSPCMQLIFEISCFMVNISRVK